MDEKKKDISKLNEHELREMLERQEKLIKNRAFLNSLPDKGKKIHEMVEKLNEIITKRQQTDNLTSRFQQIDITGSAMAKTDQELDSDDDDDIDCIDNDDDDIKDTAANHQAASSSMLKNNSNWAYESAVTFKSKPRFEKSKAISLEESIELQQKQKDEYELLRLKQASERLIHHRNPTTRNSNLLFTSQEAKERYRDTVQQEEDEDNGSQSENEVVREQEESDSD